jgi:hypothetical protein
VFIDNLAHGHILAAKKLLQEAKKDREKEREGEREEGGEKREKRGEGSMETNSGKENGTKSNTSISHRVFAISDHAPSDNWEFLEFLIVGLGYSISPINLPTSLALSLAFFLESFHYIFSPVFPHTPFLSRPEVLKVGVTHYFSKENSEQILGYKPVVSVNEAKRRTLEFYRKKYGKKKTNYKRDCFCVILMIFVAAIFLQLYA